MRKINFYITILLVHSAQIYAQNNRCDTEKYPLPSFIDQIYCILPQGEELWLGTDRGVVNVKKNKSFLLYDDFHEKEKKVESLAIDDEKNVWFINYTKHLFKLNTQSKKIEKVEALEGILLNEVIFTYQKQIIVSADSLGIIQISKDGKIKTYNMYKGHDCTILHQNPYKSRTLLVYKDQKNIYHIDDEFKMGDKLKGQEVNNEIKAIHVSPSFIVWSTYYHQYYDYSDIFEYEYGSHKDPDILRLFDNEHVVEDFAYDGYGELWIATNHGLFNHSTHTTNEGYLQNTAINCLATSDDNHTIWVGTDGDGLYKLEYKQKYKDLFQPKEGKVGFMKYEESSKNKVAFLNQNEPFLDSIIVNLLKIPEIEVEISTYTTQGLYEKVADKISTQRAKAIKNYLLKKYKHFTFNSKSNFSKKQYKFFKNSIIVTGKGKSRDREGHQKIKIQYKNNQSAFHGGG